VNGYSKTAAIVGFEYSTDVDLNDVMVEISIEKVK
jgi:hypothetical protein